MKFWVTEVLIIMCLLAAVSCAKELAPPPAMLPGIPPETAPPKSELYGKSSPLFQVTVNRSECTWTGTTLMAVNYDPEKPRIVEVNMRGEVTWEYLVPQHLRRFTNPGFDVEPLPDGNVLFVLPRNGVYEVNRKGEVVWSFVDGKVSHDADRLTGGNTLTTFGADDRENDAQVREVNPAGQIVWAWYARDVFRKPPFRDIYSEGWTHTNAVVRLPNGNTWVSLRNFGLVAEIDAKGSLIRTIGDGLFSYQHEPEPLPDGNMLVVNHREPHTALELDLKTNQVLWQYAVPRQLVRDANRLPNGNTLITGGTVILEVTPQKEVVWQLEINGPPLDKREAPGRGFFKAERIRAPAK
jgi:hypothetical protein